MFSPQVLHQLPIVSRRTEEKVESTISLLSTCVWTTIKQRKQEWREADGKWIIEHLIVQKNVASRNNC